MLVNNLNILESIVVIIGVLWTYFHEGQHKPRIEFDLDCEFLGPQDDYYLAAFRIYATNKGRIDYKFNKILLRVRGIKGGAEIKQLKGYEPIVEFPEKSFECDIIPPKYGFFLCGQA